MMSGLVWSDLVDDDEDARKKELGEGQHRTVARIARPN